MTTILQPHATKEQIAESLDHGMDTVILVDHVDAENKPVTRVFQFAQESHRKEYIKLTSWCIRNNRIMRVVPFNKYD